MAEDQKEQKEKRKKRKPVTLDVGYKPDGSRDRKYFYGRSKAEARKKKKEYEEQLKRGSTVDPNITVGEWVQVVKDTYRQNVNPLYLHMDDIPYNRLTEALGKKKVIDIRESDLQNAFNEVREMSYSTVTKYGQAIKKVFDKARKNRIIIDDPSEDLTTPPYYKGTHRCLESWEVDMILSNWHNEDARIGIWIMLMLLCGLRRGEMMALRWENVNMTVRTITICEVTVVHKSKSVIEDRAKSAAGERVLPIPKALFDALDTIPLSKRSGFVCTSKRGKQLTASSVVRGMEQFCLVMTRLLNNEPTRIQGARTDLLKADPKAKKDDPETKRIIFKFRTHDLRHTYATALYDAGVPIKAAQYFLGHADIKMTIELYTHLSKERAKLSRGKLIAHLDNWLDRRLLELGKNMEENPENDLNFAQWLSNGCQGF